MSTRNLLAVFVFGMATLTTGGCLSAARVSGESDLVRSTVATWKTAMESKSIDDLLDCHSDRYVHYMHGTKGHLREFWGNAMKSGYLDNVAVITDRAEATFRDGKALVWPVDWRGAGPDHSIEFTLEKEGGVWRIVEMDGL